MKIVLLYSGFTRTFDFCKKNHKEMLISDIVLEFHRNEINNKLDFWKEDDFYEYNKNKYPETVVENVMNQWHNMFSCFCMTNPSDGDIFVRIRYDIKLSKQIIFNSFNYKEDTVYIPTGQDYREGINDQFAFGNYKSMKKYFSVYVNHHRIFNSGKKFHPESYIKHNLEMLNVNIVRIDVENSILR